MEVSWKTIEKSVKNDKNGLKIEFRKKPEKKGGVRRPEKTDTKLRGRRQRQKDLSYSELVQNGQSFFSKTERGGHNLVNIVVRGRKCR